MDRLQHLRIRRTGRLYGALLAACILAGCAMSATSMAPDSPVKAGQWGGPHISMTVASASTDIEFDCAKASVAGAIDTDRSGAFSVAGTFQPERPGPTRPTGPPSRPMRLSGTVEGDEMHVTVVLTDQNEDVGMFALTFGRTPRLVKCR